MAVLGCCVEVGTRAVRCRRRVAALLLGGVFIVASSASAGAQELGCAVAPRAEKGHLRVEVRDASGIVPLPGMPVSVSWPGGSNETETAGEGGAWFCDLPPGTVTVVAGLSGFRAKVGEVLVRRGAVANHVIRMDLSPEGDRSGEGGIVGTVVDDATAAAVEGALVGIGETGFEAVTTHDGAFRLDGVPAGSVTLRVQHVAYGERTARIAVESGRVFDVELRLTPEPIEVDTLAVRIVAERSLRLDVSGFYERRRWMEALGLGHFMTRDEIERRRPLELSHLLGDVPRVDFIRACPSGRCAVPIVSGTASSCGNVKSRGDIGPSLYVDGHHVRLAVGAAGAGARVLGIDEIARPADVAGIEVYTGLGDLPGEFADPNAQRCGAIVIWTGN